MIWKAETIVQETNNGGLNLEAEVGRGGCTRDVCFILLDKTQCLVSGEGEVESDSQETECMSE